MLTKIKNYLFPKALEAKKIAQALTEVMKSERDDLHARLDRANVRADDTLTRLRQIEAKPLRVVK